MRAEAAKAQQAFRDLDQALLRIEESLDACGKSIRSAQRLTEDVEEYRVAHRRE